MNSTAVFHNESPHSGTVAGQDVVLFGRQSVDRCLKHRIAAARAGQCTDFPEESKPPRQNPIRLPPVEMKTSAVRYELNEPRKLLIVFRATGMDRLTQTKVSHTFGVWWKEPRVHRKTSDNEKAASTEAPGTPRSTAATPPSPVPEIGAWLQRVVRGYYNYHAVPGNFAALECFRREVTRGWLFALRRHSQRHPMPWVRFRRLADRWIPKPRILHPYPNERFYAKHPK